MSGRVNLALDAWKSSVIPGVCFLTIEPGQALAVYGRIVKLQPDGYVWAYCHHQLCPEGEETKIHRDEINLPLSIQQFNYARRLRWPSSEASLIQIIRLPSD